MIGDWSKTVAWAWGGYYSRVFLNVKGREKTGIIDPRDYERERDILIKKMQAIPDHNGRPLPHKIYKPEELYEIIRGDAPDLMVYFDDLNWRSAGTVGYDSMYLDENDTGPDDAVHDYHGIFIINDPEKKIGKNIGTKKIEDIAPTILNVFGIPKPKDMEGNIIDF